MGALKRIRPYILERTALQIYEALILPHFDYCSSVWGDCNLTLSDKLQKVQNSTARAIYHYQVQIWYNIRQYINEAD